MFRAPLGFLLLLSAALCGVSDARSLKDVLPNEKNDDSWMVDNSRTNVDGEMIGDMVLTEQQFNEIRQSKAVGKFTGRWTNDVTDDGFYRIPFLYDKDIEASDPHKKTINRALSYFNAFSCLKFEAKTTEDADAIKFIMDGGCYSSVGRIGGVQDISIGNGCQYFDIVAHEILHAMGFFHEHNRPDRDEHVLVLFKNIEDGNESNFFKEDENEIVATNSSYDVKSVMHYGSYYYSSNGKPTIVLRSNNDTFSRQRISLSIEDEAQLLDLFQCNGKRGVPYTTDCIHALDRGNSYRGTQSTTATGLTCQRWDAQTPHSHNDDPGFLPRLEENYCRNPDMDDRPWCYTTDPSYRWDYCQIPQCDPSIPVVPDSANGYWSHWTDWGECMPTCGTGYQYRIRHCVDNVAGSLACPGSFWESLLCPELEPCPNGGKGEWDNWLEWSECTKTCGNGRQYRVRTCSTSYCGSQVRVGQSCSNCTSDDASWSDYTEWSACSKRCGSGKRYRTRVCDGGFIKDGDCASKVTLKETCNTEPCEGTATKGDWLDWLDWSECNKPCGNGSQYRVRQCSTSYCGGRVRQTQLCNNRDCDLASWSEYTEWSGCSKSCNTGKRHRTRVCNNGNRNEGTCKGSVVITETCNTHTCGNIPGPVVPITNPPPITTTAIAGLSCADVDDPGSYRGDVSWTVNNEPCQRWDKQYPNVHNYSDLQLRADAGLQENYCRAPDEGDLWPWCFVCSETTRKAFCDIQVCGPDTPPPVPEPGCVSNNDYESYRGGVNTTVNGRPCAYWDDNDPHVHLYTPYNYPNGGLGHHNYCRSLGENRLWCVTAENAIYRESCQVDDCVQ